MKQKRTSFGGKKILFVVAASVFLFAACKKESTDNNNAPVSGLMAVNLIPDQPGVDFIMSGKYLTNNPIPYTNFSGTYLSVFSGNRTIGLALPNADTTLNQADYQFEPGKFYSVFAVGANGNYRNVIFSDNIDSTAASSGMALVRYINAVPDSSKAGISIKEGSTDVVSDNASFATASDFKTVTPGDVTVTASGENYSVDRTFSVEKNKVYTVMLVGLPEASDTAKAVKIKYIQNGTVSPDL